VSSNTFSPFRDFLPSGFYFVTGFSHLFTFPRLKVFSFSVALPELDTVECLMDDHSKEPSVIIAVIAYQSL
jgi:hypothetical protein